MTNEQSTDEKGTDEQEPEAQDLIAVARQRAEAMEDEDQRDTILDLCDGFEAQQANNRATVAQLVADGVPVQVLEFAHASAQIEALVNMLFGADPVALMAHAAATEEITAGHFERFRTQAFENKMKVGGATVAGGSKLIVPGT